MVRSKKMSTGCSHPAMSPFGEPDDPCNQAQDDRFRPGVRRCPLYSRVAGCDRPYKAHGQEPWAESDAVGSLAEQDEITDLLKEAGAALDAEESISRINAAINACWTGLNAADTETSARLSILPPDFQQIIRAASIVLEPSPIGRALGIEDLSDGQRSLFHFALVKSLLDFKLALEAEVAMQKAAFRGGVHARAGVDRLRLRRAGKPSGSLFSFEAYDRASGRLPKPSGSRVFVTSHSPAIVGRLEPQALRHMRLNRKRASHAALA